MTIFSHIVDSKNNAMPKTIITMLVRINIHDQAKQKNIALPEHLLKKLFANSNIIIFLNKTNIIINV